MSTKNQELITIPKEEYASLLETIEILSDPRLMQELNDAEKRILSGKYHTLKDL